MNFLASSGFASLVLLSAAAAQTEEGFTTQPTTAGWGLNEPQLEAEATPAEEEIVEETAGPVVRNGQQFGWIYPAAVVDAEAVERPLTELEMLSESESGLKYGSGLYDPKSDNPLMPVAVTLRALDKITAKYTDLTINIDETTMFGELAITPRTCDTRPPEEFPETTVFLVIDNLAEEAVTVDETEESGELDLASTTETASVEDSSLPLETSIAANDDAPLTDATLAEGLESFSADDMFGEVLEEPVTDHFFSGWMFASSPALNALEHPVYDVWVIDCKMVDPTTL